MGQEQRGRVIHPKAPGSPDYIMSKVPPRPKAVLSLAGSRASHELVRNHVYTIETP